VCGNLHHKHRQYRRVCLYALNSDLHLELKLLDKFASKTPKNYQLWCCVCVCIYVCVIALIYINVMFIHNITVLVMIIILFVIILSSTLCFPSIKRQHQQTTHTHTHTQHKASPPSNGKKTERSLYGVTMHLKDA